MADRAFITGVTGQDGSYLAELLLREGLEVYRLVRRKADGSNWRIKQLEDNYRFHFVYGDLTDSSLLVRVLDRILPRYIFNLAAQSFVPYSWDNPLATTEVTGQGALRLLEAIRFVDDHMSFYQASSSEMFGQVRETPQRESTPFHPRSPYGIAKCFAHYATVNYRESYGIFACSGILFNHESERRGTAFVTRKVTQAVARIKRGLQEKLKLGNLDARRDWGYAPDYVAAMWKMINAPSADDYVIATGENHSIRDLCQAAFGAAGLNWEQYVETDEALIRPAEVNVLLGDAAKAREQLGWQPTVSFEEMISRMLAADIDRVDRGVVWEN
jgi:GDPmannose 4,6-dehydratase